MKQATYEIRLYSNTTDWPSFEFTGSVKDLIAYTHKLMTDHGADKARMIDHKDMVETFLYLGWGESDEGLKEDITFYEYRVD